MVVNQEITSSDLVRGAEAKMENEADKAVKIINDLRRIADRVEERKPGYKEKCRRELREFFHDTSVFDALESVEIEIINE